MGCFTMGGLENLLIWVVILLVVCALLRLAVGSIVPGVPVVVVRAIGIVLWAVVAIAVIIFLFDLLGCVAYPRLR